ncbi:MAG: Do family serine endopeptidase [Treponema sp.]|jgi:Do/DeqQ family serine protease|nr:Do family serine endopeptidase [Treponema sp.]
MNLTERLSSKNFFIFNLVLIGVIFGFSLAFLSFSCSTPQGKNAVRAQINPVVIPEDALSVAESLQTVFNSVSEKVLPSVVEIKTVSVQRRQSPGFNGIPWEFFFGPRGRDGEGQGQEREFRSQGLGSGIIVRKDKNMYYVLTNNHVIEGASEIHVASRDVKEYKAELVGKDARRDLALVSFTTDDSFPLAVLGNSDEVQVGHWAIAMGNPLGEQFAFSVTMGIVSAVGRTGGPGGNINDFIQTDASINQGNSGGPLVNIRGEIIGINTWIASNNGGGSVGLGFAIPINNAKRSIDDFIKSGSANDGWLGVQLFDPDNDTLAALGLEGKRGSLASQVFIGSPAEKSGICPGDFISAVDGREVRGSTQLTQAVGNIRPGETAIFTIYRDGNQRNVTVKIESRTDEVAADSKKLWPGVMVIGLSDSIRSSLGLDKDAKGLYVINVIQETPSAIIGMLRGDRITAINDTEVKDIAAFYKVLREKTGKELWFNFIRGESSLESIKYKR